MSEHDIVFWLHRIRHDLEAAGLPVKRLTIIEDVRPAPGERNAGPAVDARQGL